MKNIFLNGYITRYSCIKCYNDIKLNHNREAISIDIKVNNAKGILIFLVVFGHFLEFNAGPYYPLFLFIYTFHMPLFITISGYLAKRMTIQKIIRLFILLIAFQIFFVFLFNYFDFIKFSLLTALTIPIYHLWYLASLIVWYLSVLGLNKIDNKKIKVMVIALIIFFCVISRYYTSNISALIPIPGAYSYTFSFQRTLSFFPFFLIGFLIPKNIMQQLYNIKPNILKLAFIPVFLVTLALLKVEHIDLLLRGAVGFSEMNLYPRLLPSVQLYIFYFLIPLICIGVLNIIPSRKTIFTNIGSKTLPIFLLHPIFILVAFKLKFFIFEFSYFVQIIIWLIFTIITIAITSNKIFVDMLKLKKIKLK
ncbi:acyltransferase family protein [Enterococcus alishanensis]